jgi:hypothetical protein
MALPTPRDTPLTKIDDEPLPLTLWFVFIIGGAIFIGWFAMFFLLQARW